MVNQAMDTMESQSIEEGEGNETILIEGNEMMKEAEELSEIQGTRGETGGVTASMTVTQNANEMQHTSSNTDDEESRRRAMDLAQRLSVPIGSSVEVIRQTGPAPRKQAQRKRSRVGDRDENGQGAVITGAQTEKFGINKTMKELHELMKKMRKIDENISDYDEMNKLFATLAIQVLDLSTAVLNNQEEKAALMDQVILLQQSSTNAITAANNKQLPNKMTYLQSAQKGLAKAVEAGICLPPPTLPDTIKHVPAEQVILYKAENKDVLPTRAEQEAFRTEVKGIIGAACMSEVSAIRATRHGGYTIIFRSEQCRNEAIEKINQWQGGISEEEKKRRIIAPKKKVAKVVCRDPPTSFTHGQILSDLYGRHNPLLSQISKPHRTAKIFETRLGWVFELSTYEAAAVEGQGYRIRYDSAREMRVEEFIPLQQCYRCCLFGHSAKDCNSAHEHCRLCGAQGHSGKDCLQKDNRQAWRCANCIWNNIHNGTKLPEDHAAAQLHKCAIAQNEKAIRKNQLATAGVFTTPTKHFVPRTGENGTVPASSDNNKSEREKSSSSAPSTAMNQQARRRAPSVQLARCYTPPTTASAASSSSSSSSGIRTSHEAISLRPSGSTISKVPLPQQRSRGVSRGATGRGRGRETYDLRSGTNSSESCVQRDTITYSHTQNTQYRGNNGIESSRTAGNGNT